MDQVSRQPAATARADRRYEQWMEMDAELRVPAATVQVVRFHLPGPVDETLRGSEPDAYRIDLCLTPRPRNARACYRDRWGARRFERIGTVFAVPPGETLQARSDGGRQGSIVCYLRPEVVRAWFDGDLKWNPRRLEASLDIANASIRNLLLRLAAEARHPGLASQVLVESIAVQLAIELSRYATSASAGPAPGGLTAGQLRLIDERLREVREPPTLAELAGLCRLSVRQLTRAFRASRGSSIGEYVTRSRIDHARQLLATDQPIKAIAHSLGFSSSSAFAFAFRRATGETPGQFRRRATHYE